MAKSIDDVEFWLPPEFLTDDDILMEMGNNVLKEGKNGGKFGFESDGPKGSNAPYEVPFGYGAFGIPSDLSSPVESLVGSTETESDEEDYIAGLTRQMAHSTLEDDSVGHKHGFYACEVRGWNSSGSPQSTLCPAGVVCRCRKAANRNCQPGPNNVAAWDLLCAAAEEVARMRIAEEANVHNQGRGLLGTPRKPHPISGPAENPDHGFGYLPHHSLSYQKLQAAKFQHLKQRQMMRQPVSNWSKVNAGQYQQAARNGLTGRTVGMSRSAWPSLQPAQPQPNGTGMQAVFLGAPAGKRECSGTGVFLPRRVATPIETRKKPGINTVLLPARVVQALKLNLDDSGVHSQLKPRVNTEADSAPRCRGGNFMYYTPRHGSRPDPTVNQELQLPQDWTY